MGKRILFLVLLVACQQAGGPDVLIEAAPEEATHDPIVYANAYYTWLRNYHNSLDLCFEFNKFYFGNEKAVPEADIPLVRQFIKERIATTWGATTQALISWTDTCPTSASDQWTNHIRVNFFYTNPGTTAATGPFAGTGTWPEWLGFVWGGGPETGTPYTYSTPALRAAKRGFAPGMAMLGFRSDWNRNNDTRLDAQAILDHEFGHVMAFDHEQNHPNSPCNETRVPTADDMALFGYDADSIMSYCGLGQNWPSQGDIAGARYLWGGRYPSAKRKNLIFSAPNDQVEVWGMIGSLRRTQTWLSVAGMDVIGSGDFDGDAVGDLLLRSRSNNYVQVNFLNNFGGIKYRTGVGTVVYPTANLRFVGTGRLNADSNEDVIWQDSTTGTIEIWMMNGSVNPPNIVRGSILSPNFTARAVGDFDGDGVTDVIGRDGSGNLQVALMSATGTRKSVTSPASQYTVPSTWMLKGTGDFDGDGKADLYWQTTAAENFIWNMSGLAAVNSIYLGYISGWDFLGIGDFDGNGYADVSLINGTQNTVLEFQPNRTWYSLSMPPVPMYGSLRASLVGVALGDMTPDIPRTEPLHTPLPIVPNGWPGLNQPSQSGTSIFLSWNAVLGAQRYTVYGGPVGGPLSPIRYNVSSPYTQLLNEPIGTRQYQVEAISDAGGSGLSAPVTFTVTPMPPTGLSLSPGDTSITATWAANSSVGATDYFLSYQRTGDPTWTNVPQPRSTYSFTAIALTPGLSYSFRIAARYDGFVGEYSPVVTAVPGVFNRAQSGALSAMFNSAGWVTVSTSLPAVKDGNLSTGWGNLSGQQAHGALKLCLSPACNVGYNTKQIKFTYKMQSCAAGPGQIWSNQTARYSIPCSTTPTTLTLNAVDTAVQYFVFENLNSANTGNQFTFFELEVWTN